MTLRDSLNASTEHVLNTSLPSLIHHDGYRAPDRLHFHIPIEHISTETRKRARAIVEKAEHNITRVWVEENGRGRHVYYVLSQSQTKFTKITDALIKRRVLAPSSTDPWHYTKAYLSCTAVSSEFPVLSTEYPVLSTEYPVLSTEYSVVNRMSSSVDRISG